MSTFWNITQIFTFTWIWYLQLAGGSRLFYEAGQKWELPLIFVFLSAQCCINFVKKCMKRFMASRADSTLSTQGNTSLLHFSTYFGLFSCIMVLNFLIFILVSAHQFLIVRLIADSYEVLKNCWKLFLANLFALNKEYPEKWFWYFCSTICALLQTEGENETETLFQGLASIRNTFLLFISTDRLLILL